ncbi:hypothetical protein F0562_032392 [Nyssa sinensis]|uniref:Uncharacterized protein n=1 Tax=Nyssa sinensis TaxID=561372 RepID=A0A5J5AMX2_9ASTE|nr:hypothetical protein F0562_032392 [Nyssa sinensis]
MDSIRSFLKDLNCLDELLLMEKERGNFLEAADIAKLKKDLLLEADLVEKAGYFREASMLILWYVFSNSLHPLSSKCWPPKWLTQKDKLLTKAKSTAKNHSDPFYDFVCKEAEILSEEKINGNVFEMGLQFIQFWKQKAPTGVGRIKRGYEIDKIEQDMLERCAHHYHDLKDNRTMMRYVKAFHSRDLIRSFLKNLNCLDELLSIEKEWGNFLEAADIAKLKKDLLLESDLVEKAGYFREASMLILWYVFSNSLPPLSSKCRFPKQYTQKDELLTKAISIAKNDSDTFYDFVSKEAEILSEKNINGNVFEMGLKFIQLWKQKAPTDVGRVKRGYEIDKIEQHMLERCARHYHDLKDNRTMMKYIRDFHSSNLMRTFLMSLNCLDEVLLLEEEWGNFLQAAKIAKQKGYLLREAGLLEKAGHFDEACMVLLLYVFASSLWVSGSQGWPLKKFNQKEELLTMAKSCIGTSGVSKYGCYEEFCLNFMGVRQHDGNKNTIYLLLYSDAIWVREVDYRSLWGKGNLVSIDAHNFVSAALSYWCSELLSVGLKVLETLNTLYDYSLRNCFSLFQQTVSLLHICEVAKFLQENKFLNCRHNGELVQKSLELASRCHFGNVFPLDWRKSLIESMIFLRGSKLSSNLVSEAISRNISSKSPLTYGQVGRVVMMILGSGKLSNELYERIVRSFDGNLQWRAFTEEIVWNIVPDFKLGSATRNFSNASGEVSLVCRFHEAVEDTYYANWRTEQDYISPACFLYLVERLLILASYFQGYIFTTKSSVVEWLIFQEWSINPSTISINDTELSVILGKIHNSMACIVQELLLNKDDTMEWFETSKNSSDDYYPVLVLRSIVLLSLICVNSGKHFDKLFYLLGRSDITSVLPCEFCEALLRARKCYFIYALADALGKIENPLVLVSLGYNFSNFLCPDAIFINMEANRCSEEILRELFQEKGVTTHSRSGNPEKGFDLPLFNFAHAALNTQICNEAYPGKKCGHFWEIFYALETFEFRKGGDIMGFMSVASIIKVEVEKIFQLSSAAVASCQENSYQNDNLLVEVKSMLAELKLLSFALDISERTLEDNISTIGKLSKSLQFRRPRLEPFLDRLFLQNEKDTAI